MTGLKNINQRRQGRCSGRTTSNKLMMSFFYIKNEKFGKFSGYTDLAIFGSKGFLVVKF